MPVSTHRCVDTVEANGVTESLRIEDEDIEEFEESGRTEGKLQRNSMQRCGDLLQPLQRSASR